MAIRVSSLADGRGPLLVAAILAMLLGLGTATSGLLGHEPAPEEAAETSDPPIRTDLDGAAATPLALEIGFAGDSACLPKPPQASRPGTAAVASADENRQEYLGKMAAMQRRRRASAATTPDPYQASLNPAVYLVGDAPPMAHDPATRAPYDQPC